ncbi:MAG TPA: YdeI/OmpD-associated family protein [Ferruginibacter sp.]|nr:YdeI/OmpD-associated family protein [Ferruginibacter sp.]
MPFRFSATIYKTGINACVDVPLRITGRMAPVKGYIPVQGTISGHPFQQTLVPVKDGPYRLFVNGPMLKGAGAAVGDKASFRIEQDDKPRTTPMPALLKQKLSSGKLLPAFLALTPYRQKEILRYLNNLKSDESLLRNIDKVIKQLKMKNNNPD